MTRRTRFVYWVMDLPAGPVLAFLAVGALGGIIATALFNPPKAPPRGTIYCVDGRVAFDNIVVSNGYLFMQLAQLRCAPPPVVEQSL